ncbi:MAG: hypothetical protein KH369_15945 [Paraclostridium bifermentans]|uniref:hypothetical protein n=1 Tax=Paraclostridium bifermentans TaxID=1490 RepID=UPI001D299681|nr:hypothetical protein [Paraclostridium bifermentans]MBS6509694.1 hypothetical protein [Paraclostridium bifermentans]
MNSEAYQINIENEAKKLAEDVIKKALRQASGEDLIKSMAKRVAKEALFEIENIKKDRRFHNTKLLMENYKNLKEHVDGIKEGINLKYEFRDGESLLCIKSEYLWLESLARSKARTIEMMEYVDSKIKYLIYEWENKNQYEIIDSFIMFYIENKTDEDIRQKYNCGQNTPKRWRDKILKELSILLWGIDAIQM